MDGKTLGILAIGGLGIGALVVASRGRSNSGSGLPTLPPPEESTSPTSTGKSVAQRMAEALATGDPRTIREEAKRLRLEGYAVQADALEKSASVLEGELATGTRSPLPAKPAPAPSTTSKTPVLKEGSVGPAVVILQERLTSLGYDAGKPDGRFGPATKRAVQAFQKDQGLAPDGIVGRETAARLVAPTSVNASTTTWVEPASTSNPAPVIRTASVPASTVLLKQGSKGPSVLALQTRLVALGYSQVGKPDGAFGPKTKAAVVLFQKEHGLTPDGIVGPATQAALIAGNQSSSV